MENGIVWMGLLAALLFAVARGASAAEAWRTVEQPELEQALEHAPVLKPEALGEPARGVNTWEHWLVPNPDGARNPPRRKDGACGGTLRDHKSWDALQVYFKEYYGPTWLYAIDLGTGQVKKQRLPDNHQFYLSGRTLGFDGKYYIATPSAHAARRRGMDLFVYDPATNTVEDRGQIVPGLGGEVRPLATGPDGRIYGSGTWSDKVGLYVYDPKLRKVVKDFGGVGPSHPNGAWSRYEMAVDETHAYIVSGMLPAWYLVAVNLETGEDKVLLESPTERTMDLIVRFPGALAVVPQGGGAPNKEYWLYHGQAIPKVNDTPPWPRQASPWDKAAPKPEVYWGQIDPDAQGHAVLWYRLPEAGAGGAEGAFWGPVPGRFGARDERQRSRPSDQWRGGRGRAARGRSPGGPGPGAKAPQNPSPDARPEELGWRSVRLEGVETYPHRISPLALLPDGRLFSGGEDYVGSFLFDPRTDKATLLGRNQGLAPYTHILHGDKLYSSGYPGGPLYVYDPKKPWTVYHGGPPGHPAPSREDPASNPRELGSLGADTRVAIAHSSALGADGKLYFGGFGERNYTGGGFGWYDPKTEQFGGFWKPLSGYAVHWLAPLQGGRLIAISTSKAADELHQHRAPEEAKLFLYDVAQAKIVREIVPVPKARTTGLVTEVAPGRLLGLTVDTVDPAHPGSGLLYGIDVATGEVLFRKPLPWPVSIDNYWPHWVDPSYEYLDLVHGPDGFLWTYLKDVLVRIDPRDASVHVVGKIEPVGHPTFVGRDLYLSGPEQLRRIRDIVPTRK